MVSSFNLIFTINELYAHLTRFKTLWFVFHIVWYCIRFCIKFWFNLCVLCTLSFRFRLAFFEFYLDCALLRGLNNYFIMCYDGFWEWVLDLKFYSFLICPHASEEVKYRIPSSKQPMLTVKVCKVIECAMYKTRGREHHCTSVPVFQCTSGSAPK